MIRCLVFFGLDSVEELPISCKTPLDCLWPTLIEPVRAPEHGETFSVSETAVQLLDSDLGVTLRPGTAAPRKPAFRSWSLLVCLVFGAESGREAGDRS